MNLTLDHLAPDHSGSITAVHASGMAAERMAALGLIPGKRVAMLRRAPFGGPLHLRIGPTSSIRRLDARAVALPSRGRSGTGLTGCTDGPSDRTRAPLRWSARQHRQVDVLRRLSGVGASRTVRA
jgi:ferrous iron transport protein A